MSVNYYVRQVGETGEGLHIGKHVGGREFLFRAHPTIRCCADWYEYLSQPAMEIVAESGYTVPLEEFWSKATTRPADVGGPHAMRSALPPWPRHDQFRDREHRGVPFADYEFC